MFQLPSDQILNWALFAARESDLDAAILVPTFVFGRGALLAKKPAEIGTRVSVYHQTEKGEQQQPHKSLSAEQQHKLEEMDMVPGKPAAVSTPNNSIGSSGKAIVT